jgi:hypothetical protein
MRRAVPDASFMWTAINCDWDLDLRFNVYDGDDKCFIFHSVIPSFSQFEIRIHREGGNERKREIDFRVEAIR